ncbi:MAG TPA: glycosyltransferase [Rhizomicrobium sp.]|jgi:hypothetical protein|nr:glycosyltransferase [Rhizomicrobium sp.]
MLDDKSAVMATEFRFGSVGGALAHGMRRKGWAVQEVDTRNFFTESEHLPAKIMGRLTRSLSVDAYNAAICRTVERYKATVFVTVKGLDIRPATLEFLKRRGVTTVNYYPDVHFRHGGLDAAILPKFDLFFTTKSFHMAHLRTLLDPQRVFFLHHGYCDDLHYPQFPSVEDADYLADITYVGNHADYKEAWLGAIARRLPQVKLFIVGYRWDTAKDPALRARSLGYAITGDAYSRILQRSRINLAIHGGSFAPEGWEDWVSTRTFEIPACKGFMLHIDNPEVRELFAADEEIGLFRDEDEMVAGIERYLADPGLRGEMIERAFARCVPAYGYDARAASICAQIDRLRGPRAG